MPGDAAFQTLRADIREIKTDVRQEIQKVREEVKEVREEIKVSEVRQRQELRDTKAELKVDNQVVTERLDRVFERLPAPQAGQ